MLGKADKQAVWHPDELGTPGDIEGGLGAEEAGDAPPRGILGQNPLQEAARAAAQELKCYIYHCQCL